MKIRRTRYIRARSNIVRPYKPIPIWCTARYKAECSLKADLVRDLDRALSMIWIRADTADPRLIPN